MLLAVTFPGVQHAYLDISPKSLGTVVIQISRMVLAMGPPYQADVSRTETSTRSARRQASFTYNYVAYRGHEEQKSHHINMARVPDFNLSIHDRL